MVKALKLEDVFSHSDMSEMSSLGNLTISDMIHASELEVDEEGTVATTVTALEMVLVCSPMSEDREPIKFYVDRPFLLTIGHKSTPVSYTHLTLPTIYSV